MSSSLFHSVHRYHNQFEEEGDRNSATIPSSQNMIKTLGSNDRVGLDSQPQIQYLSAPKRKRNDDEISASRRQDDDSDDDFVVFPLHKRTNSSTMALSSYCTASQDTERRDGPADDDDVLDDETEALVKKFRTSVFRGPQAPVSPSCTSISSASAFSPLAQYDDDEEDDDEDGQGHDFFDLPGIARATTICDDSSDFSTDNSCYADPPEMDGSRPTSPREEEIIEHGDDVREHWPSSLEEKDPILEARRERPQWLTPLSSSAGAAQPSPLWNTSSNKSKDSNSFAWSAGSWTGMFHQGSA